MEMKRTAVSLELPLSYSLEGEGAKLLVLHGYSDSAPSARRRLLGAEPLPDYAVLAPNGPFPAPIWKAEKYREAYAWYFRDSDTGRHMIEPEVSARALVQLIRKLGLADEPWTIVGFSQGGFFAPHLIREGLRVRMLIVAGSGFRLEAYQGLPPLDVRALHGDADDLVPIEKSRASFAKLQELGFGTAFHTMPGVKHNLDSGGRAVLRGWLTEKAVLTP